MVYSVLGLILTNSRATSLRTPRPLYHLPSPASRPPLLWCAAFSQQFFDLSSPEKSIFLSVPLWCLNAGTTRTPPSVLYRMTHHSSSVLIILLPFTQTIHSIETSLHTLFSTSDWHHRWNWLGGTRYLGGSKGKGCQNSLWWGKYCKVQKIRTCSWLWSQRGLSFEADLINYFYWPFWQPSDVLILGKIQGVDCVLLAR